MMLMEDSADSVASSAGAEAASDRAKPSKAAGPADAPQPRYAILTAIREGARPDRIYWLMNALSTVIACYGLFANSPAVVIGAMVMAMLLGPLAGVALGLNEGDRPLLRTALLSLGGGIIWILGIAVIIGLIHRDVPLTEEILSRTNPRLFDLIVALAGGAAGAVAVLSPRVGTAIVGVAVATALVPPLAAAGILLARADFDLAGGALLLSVTNFAAIQLAFSAVFWAGGYRRLTGIGGRGLIVFLRRDALSLALVCLLAALFGLRLHSAVSRALFDSDVRTVLRRHFDDTAGLHLIDVRFGRERGTTLVTAIVRGPRAPSAAAVAAAQSDLPAPSDGTSLSLQVRFVATVIVTPHGPVLSGGTED
jgi:uncharacterized hydrophobic protein (TIGR00271 family)